jgi:hypothetical protein
MSAETSPPGGFSRRAGGPPSTPLAGPPDPGQAAPVLLLLLTACVHDLPWRDTADTGPAPEPAPTLADIAAGTTDDGEFVVLEGVVAITGATLDGRTFFVQAADGAAGLRVDLADPGDLGPLGPGVVMDVQGYVDHDIGSARLVMWEPDWLYRSGTVDPPAPAALDPETDPLEANAGRLVQLADRTTAGCASVIGDVPLDGDLTLSDRFGPLGDLPDGATIATVGGVLVRESQSWQLWPRGAADLGGVSGGAPCPTD